MRARPARRRWEPLPTASRAGAMPTSCGSRTRVRAPWRLLRVVAEDASVRQGDRFVAHASSGAIQLIGGLVETDVVFAVLRVPHVFEHAPVVPALRLPVVVVAADAVVL